MPFSYLTKLQTVVRDRGFSSFCFVMCVILIQNITLVSKEKEIGYSKANVSAYHPGTWI